MVGQEIERAARLLESLYESGGLSKESTDALIATGTAAREIQIGLGKDLPSEETLLASVLVDDSPSIQSNLAEIRLGHRLMLEALTAEQSSADILVHTRALNRGVISPYQRITQAVALTEENYSEGQLLVGTPLYSQSVLTLGTVITKAHEQELRGGKVRTFTLIITDGGDNASGGITAAHVAVIVKDMLEFSTNHIVAGMGVGNAAAFRNVFRSMGIPDGWIFTPDSTVDELRAVFRRVAASLRLAASSEAGFLQLASGPAAA